MAEIVPTMIYKKNSGLVSALELIEVGNELMPHHRALHKHDDAQLLLVLNGLVTCEVASGLWMVPPQCALWIPVGMVHSARGVGNVQLQCVYFDPKLTQRLPTVCCTLRVSPLLRELLIEISHLKFGYDADGPDARMIGVMLERLADAPAEQSYLPIPSDPRLRKIANHLIADPCDRRTKLQWARTVGMSESTLLRLLYKETGMNFTRWRQQLHIMLALQRLAEGTAVQTVALDLGYESSSAFVAMFRKILGKPPMKFLADRTRGLVAPRLGMES
jgi:AraC-like DNA-binding protein